MSTDPDPRKRKEGVFNYSYIRTVAMVIVNRFSLRIAFVFFLTNRTNSFAKGIHKYQSYFQGRFSLKICYSEPN